ncbi:hypothetical protein GCM10027589_21320 [Actinocorallia lasiicapitis]
MSPITSHNNSATPTPSSPRLTPRIARRRSARETSSATQTTPTPHPLNRRWAGAYRGAGALSTPAGKDARTVIPSPGRSPLCSKSATAGTRTVRRHRVIAEGSPARHPEPNGAGPLIRTETDVTGAGQPAPRTSQSSSSRPSRGVKTPRSS